jgi:DNA-binding SARP family transcriptional activator
MYSLRFLGSPCVSPPARGDGERLLQPRALALLACLGAAGPEGCTRDRLVGLFWPDLDSRHARHALSVQLHQIRRTLETRAVLTHGDFVRLNPDVVSTDLAGFQQAIRQGELERAAGLYRGSFLEGFHLAGALEFERWMEDQRQRLAVQCLDVLESLAVRAEGAGRPADAIAWWQRAAQHDPFNSRVALACARALAAAGDRGNGVQFLREHARRLRTDLEIGPDQDILDAISSGDFGVVPAFTGSPRGPDPTATPAREEAGDTPSDNRPQQVADARPRSWRGRAALLAATIVLAIVGTMAVRARHAEGRDAGRIVILPTEGPGLDPTIAVLVSSHLHAAMAEWPSFGPASSPSNAGTTAGRFPARLALTSRATPVAGGIELHASLTDAADGTPLAAASVIGSPESLRASAEHLLVDLFARAYHLPEDRIAALHSFGPAAVRLYVQAAGSEPPERTRLLHEALARDDRFAPAAVALLETSPDYYNQQRGDEWEPIAETAWSQRGRLSPADRAFVEAKVGWRFIPAFTAAQHMAAWERAVELAPDRLTHWHGLAFACYRWCSELQPDWRDHALRLHDTLLLRGDQTLLEHALEVAFLAGDTARMRRYADRLSDEERYGQWLVASGLGREHESAQLRRLMDRGEFLDMRVGNMATLTGIGLEDAETVARQDANSGNPYQLKAQVVARERGRHAEYRALRDKMFQLGQTTNLYDIFLANLTVWEWAYFAEPEADSVLDRHERMLSGIIASEPRRGPDTLAVAHCALAQLRLRRGDPDGVAEAVAYLSHDAEARDLATSRMCAPFLKLLAARGGDRDMITHATRRLNDVVRKRPLDLATGGGMINVEIMLAGAINLELARTYLALGYPEVGLEAVERRPYRAGLWSLFGFHNEFLLVEARLLAAAGVRSAALDRYDRYFRLRPEPPDLPAWRTTWEKARAERLALISTNDG